jgi:hypothetical protein
MAAIVGAVTSLRPWSVRDSRRRSVVIAGALAVILHLPFTPLPFIIRLLAHAMHPSERWDYQDDTVVIPITLLEDETRQSASPPADPSAGGEGPSGTPTAAPTETDAGAVDAHAPDAQPADAQATDAELDAAAAEGGADAEGMDAESPRLPRDAGKRPRNRRDAAAEEPTPLATDDDGASRPDGGDAAGGGRVKDTMALVGGLGKLVNGKANVSLVLWFATMREHRLGPLVSGMLACNPQWRDFLGDRVDPLRDLDGLMMFGPRMADSSKVTVLAQSRMSEAKVREILSFLAMRSQGGPIEAGPGMTAVRFEADRAPRVAFTHPRNMIIITPPEGFEQLRRHREPLSLPKGRGQALSLTMVTPARPLRALRVQLPESLTEMRVSIFTSDDGGVDVDVEFDDADPAAAEVHAGQISEQARAAFSPMLSDLEFVADDNRLRAKTHLSGLFSSLALGFARNSICPAPARDVPAGR